MKPILAVEGLAKRYGVKQVVDQVSFVVTTGDCLGIIGPNGAGKTTLFNLLDGSVQPDAGKVALEGDDITGLSQYRRARRGVGRAFQIPRPFVGLTVFENVLAGVMNGTTQRGTAPQRRALNVLETVGLADKRGLIAGGLPLLDRKRLELAKAMSVGTKLLLLDEIAAGLTEHEVLELVDIVKALKPDHAIVWIEHIAHALVAAADRIMVLHFGAKLMEGSPAEVLASPSVQDVYLGIAVDDTAHA